MIVFCSGVRKANKRPKAQKKLFLSSRDSLSSSTPLSNKSNKLKDAAAVSHNRGSFHEGAGEKTAWEQGFDLMRKDTKGAKKVKGSKGGWAAETGKQGKDGWERERDDWEGGWEKGKAGWGRGKGRGGWKGGKVQKKKNSPLDGFDDDISPDFVPCKRRSYTKADNKIIQERSVYTQPDQKLRGTKQNERSL